MSPARPTSPRMPGRRAGALPARSPARSRGAALIVSLVMLIIIALIGVSAIQASSTGLRIGRNAQVTQQAQLAAQMAIDRQLNALTTFTGAPTAPATSTSTIDVDGDGTADFSVVVDRPRCVGAISALGYSYLASPPRDTTWEIRAVATEVGGSGASAEIVQGVRVRLPLAADCPG